MRINIYPKSAGTNHSILPLLAATAEGARKLGWEVKICDDLTWCQGELDVFWGSWKSFDMDHHKLKRDIVANSKNFIVLETRLIGHHSVGNFTDMEYARVGLNGFLCDTGFFGKVDNTSKRWQLMSQHLQRIPQPVERNADGYFLIIMQLANDASLRGLDINQWALKTCQSIRVFSKRKIVIRMPQRIYNYNQDILQAIARIENVEFLKGTSDNIVSSLAGCFCSITYSSGMGVDSLIAGRPTIAMDAGSFAFSCSDHEITGGILENPKLENRDQQLNDLAYFQWNAQELATGEPLRRLLI